MITNDLSQSVATLVSGLAAVLLFMSFGLLIAQRQQKLTVVDTMWGLGFVLVALVSALTSLGGDGDSALRWILLAMVGVWGCRLAWHLQRRNSKLPEDPRYQELADADGRSFTEVALKRVFLPQGIAMFLVATPIMVGANNEDVSIPLLVVGLLVWAIGFFFEAVGDAQLAAFKADPASKGQVMDKGLWRYTRHPNYFGDAAVWWGLGLLALHHWAGLIGLVGVALMTWLLAKGTGAKLLESSIGKRRPGYVEYVKRTSGFIPLPPKKITTPEGQK